MRRSNRTWLIPALIGLAVGLAGVSLLISGGMALLRIQVAASDLLFLRADGPKLGRRPAATNVVLVEYDQASAAKHQGVASYEQDIRVYRALLDAGASLVSDTRMIADAADFESSAVRPLLESMLAADAKGRWFRDVWVPGSWPAEQIARFRPLIAHNLLNMHPNADSFFDSRLYPLVVAAADGVHETMPLVLARQALEIAPTTSPETLDQLKRCGIIALWQSTLPPGTSLPAALRSDVPTGPADYRLGALRVPWYPLRSNSSLVPPAGYWISYAAPPDELERISYLDATNPEVAAKTAGKIVLIGYAASADPTSDTYSVPTSVDRAAAVEVVAAALATLLAPDLMRAASPWVGCCAALVLACLTALAGGLLRPLHAAAAVIACLGLFLLLAVLAFRTGWLVDVVVAPTAGLAAGVLAGGERYWREVRAKTRIVDLFGRYVPKAVVAQLIQQRKAESLALGGVTRDVTVLFADIRGFTSYAERAPPEEVLQKLNELLKIMVDCTFAHEGTVDKFIGDAILVLFNAPLDQPDHVLRAARTAWDIQQGLRDHPSGLTVGIGIHRGEAVVGRVGTPERMEYTAIGSTVNIASRLCSVAPSGQVVVSADVARALDGQFTLEPQPPVQVKGIEGALSTSLLRGQRD